MLRHTWLLLPLLACALASARAGDVTFTSPPTRTHLLELYTSEGCSSCPPAEAWLSKLKDNPRVWRDFVPVSFHVDYWDRLGWPDPFASKQWTARQYRYSGRWGSGSVYTPGFVLDGAEWHNNGLPSAASETPGVLQVTTHGDSVQASFTPEPNDRRKFDLHVARLGFGLQVNVKAGENSGRKLEHDFVVLGLTKAPLTGNSAEVHLPAANPAVGHVPREGIAAWVTVASQIEPIQATGGWLR